MIILSLVFHARKGETCMKCYKLQKNQINSHKPTYALQAGRAGDNISRYWASSGVPPGQVNSS